MKLVTYDMPSQKKSGSKFDELTFSDDRLVLKYKNKQQNEISFADVDKLFIKKHKLHPIIGLAIISSPFLLICLSVLYSPFDIVTIAAFCTVPPVFINVINYKRYKFNVFLKDGTIFSKRISNHRENEIITVLDKVNAKYLHYNSGALKSV